MYEAILECARCISCVERCPAPVAWVQHPVNYCALRTVFDQENLPEEFSQTSVLVLCLLVVNTFI